MCWFADTKQKGPYSRFFGPDNPCERDGPGNPPLYARNVLITHGKIRTDRQTYIQMIYPDKNCLTSITHYTNFFNNECITMKICNIAKMLLTNLTNLNKRPVEILVGDIYFPQTLISQSAAAIHTTELSPSQENR